MASASVKQKSCVIVTRLAFKAFMYLWETKWGSTRRLEHVWQKLKLPESPHTFESADGLLFRARPAFLGDIIAVYGREGELEVENLLRSLPSGGRVLDVGAHIGGFAVRAAQRVGPTGTVIAVEPIPGNCVLLNENSQLNHLSNIIVLNKAASAINGKCRLLINRADSMWASSSEEWANLLNRGGLKENLQEVEVESVALDDLRPENGQEDYALVKIDTEGTEVDVILGAKGLLRAQKINTLVIEIHLDKNWAPIERILADNGYTSKRFPGNHLIAARA